jgi:2-dehydropantoate 2-reductase
MKVAVYGAGAVGGYFGARLAQAGADVHLIARGAHLEALRSRGLRIESPMGTFTGRLPATDDPATIGPCDYVLVCVKTYDLPVAATRTKTLLQPDTAVVSIQNGVDAEQLLAEVLGSDHVVGGAAFILASVTEPGIVVHTGGPARLVFGELDGRSTPRARRLLETFTSANVNVELSSDIATVLWNKFAYICAHAGVTALSRLPIGTLREVPESWETFRRLSAEVCAVAAAENVPLPPDAPARHQALAKSLEPDSRSSLHYDLTHGKPLELEALHGTVVRKARAHGVPVPVTETVYAMLKPWDRKPGDVTRA